MKEDFETKNLSITIIYCYIRSVSQFCENVKYVTKLYKNMVINLLTRMVIISSSHLSFCPRKFFLNYLEIQKNEDWGVWGNDIYNSTYKNKQGVN